MIIGYTCVSTDGSGRLVLSPGVAPDYVPLCAS